jgi:antitoxin (DNA-binding transcriptional repressor) of toxin-antitoxin stability system
MEATLTQLRRQTRKVLRPVLQGARRVVLTEHGEAVAEISPKSSPDRVRALELLRAIGPVKLASRC